LLDLPRLTTQLCALERRTSRSGRDVVDHPVNAHDDVINAAAGALVRVVNKKAALDLSWIDGTTSAQPEADRNAEWRRRQLAAYINSAAGTRPGWSY
jgi:hypothetical protein